METTNVNTTNKTLLWIIGGCAAVLICGCAAGFLAFGGLVWLGLQTPENATCHLDMPAQAGVNESFQIQIEVQNTGSTSIELNSIDISMNFLEGLVIEATEPHFTSTDGYDSFGESYMTYYFEKAIPPGETMTVVFDAKSITAGDFSGDIDVCIDSEFNCITNVARIVINK